MSDIFLSYSRDDQAIARRFAEVFEREGLTVWWDQTLRSGENYDQVTERALREARAVVVLWSKHSVDSRWVRAEATQADRNGTLMPVMIEECNRPIMFELKHTAELAHWKGDANDSAWLTFLRDVRQFVKKGTDPLGLSADDSRNVMGRSTTISASSPVERAPSIAVLPFANMSGDKEQEYFSDGLAEDIINALVQISGLRVIARTSAFAFKGQHADIRQIARTLEIDHVLEGSVRRSGNRIRVSAQLISASNGSHLWSERYDRELADVFAMQDEISAAISEALKVKLSPQVAAKPRHMPALPAYEALLKARYYHWKLTAESLDQAKLLYEQAIALDPLYGLAHASYADHLIGRTVMGLAPIRKMAPLIRAMAQRALELDPSLAEPHETLCLIATFHDYDWLEAGRQFALATPSGRGSPQAHCTCGVNFFLVTGRREEAVEQLNLAVQADPLHLTYRAMLALSLGAVGRYDEAEEFLLNSRNLDPNFVWTECCLAYLRIARKHFTEALPFAEKAFSLAPWYAPSIGLFAGLLVRTGAPDRGHEIASVLGIGDAYGASKGLMIFKAICGDIDAAADWSEKAIEERDPEIPHLLQGMVGEPLRASPRWPKLASLMNLREVAPADVGLVPTGVTNV